MPLLLLSPYSSTVLPPLPGSLPINASLTQPAIQPASRNQLTTVTAGSCYHGSSNATLFSVREELVESSSKKGYSAVVSRGGRSFEAVFVYIKGKGRKIIDSMLSSLANYLLGGNISTTQNSRNASNSESLENFPVVARLSQVEVEGDDWILIDRTIPLVEGATALEESWYVTPPACFTRAGPVNVETSPLEDLLIEHPSMSVYRATTVSPVAPDTPPPTPDATEERDLEEDITPPARTSDLSTVSLERSLRRSEDDDILSRPAIHDGRPANNRTNSDKVRVIQLRSAQKVLEKRSTQALKRGRLERSNKLREVFSVKGKRPRRQDRLRLQNSGANNNRKC
ncbi:uncharacterized protein LOC118448756 isoform X1 [Vespa mandarinia]|uniref:uncharacterized protein LOC118448756 isoform X1 n=2 Tax=Vespa mandarinia TaxID=7446 RepID=UPI001619D586|nr:uncharacterized protein LOC118448756 isoform X1 [Vespa mandarinia]